ncbi:hypothetical protein SSX86_026668 [Deinandra increscens subsp. villosa]|uniref:Glutamine amidotransferase type-2 domain-containing protein n=1 Tax=Deinandra increscens subsp. villosa TaxID=3103831 RepID=A0AAP0CLT9_9ASTR
MVATATAAASVARYVISSTESHPPDQNLIFNDEEDDKPREECGVVGIYGDPEASRLCYLALHALQHRGQEGAGIVAATPDGILKSVTGVGLVSEVFNQSKLDQLPGDNAMAVTGVGLVPEIVERDEGPREMMV